MAEQPTPAERVLHKADVDKITRVTITPLLPDIDLRGPLTELVCEFVVVGDPVGQGRVSFRGKGRGAFHSNEHILNPWRAEIGRAFARWVLGMGQQSPWEALTGPLQVDRFYTVQKPATKKSQRPWPIVTSAKNSDIDHYDRAVFDGLSKCGAIQDDALIIGGAHWKAYPNTHPLCPPEPGVHIWIYTVGDPQ